MRFCYFITDIKMKFYKICLFLYLYQVLRTECQNNKNSGYGVDNKDYYLKENEKVSRACNCFRGHDTKKIENIKMYNDIDKCITCLLKPYYSDGKLDY